MLIDAGLTGDLAGAPAEAARLRASGYDGLWSAELAHDPFLPLARAADEAAPLELGTSIAVAFARTPMTVANTSWDLQALSGGRFVLGLGSQVKGHIERRFSMPWSHPAPRMREFVLALRAIWGSWQHSAPLDFRGEYYTHTLMTPNFDPGPLPSGPPKVVLAAVGRAMTRVAAEVADGLLVHGFTTPRYVREVTLPTLEEGLAAAGRPRSEFEVKYAPFVVTGRTEEEMARSADIARERIAFYGSTPAYRGVFEVHGWHGLQEDLNALARKGEWKAMGRLVDDEVLGAFAVVAPADELPAAFGRWVAGLADRTGFAVPGVTDPDQVREQLDEVRRAASHASPGA